VREKESNQSHDIIRHLIQPEAAAIIERYKAGGDSEFLLHFESKYAGYDSFRHFVSKKVRGIAKITGFEGLTLYWARRSWATIADGIDIPEKTVSKALGHTDRTVAGRNYIAFDWSKVDRANRAVIDRTLSVRV
jgi:integrase